MREKITEEIRSLEKKISWKQRDLDEAVENFKESAAKYNAYEIATFLPGSIQKIEELRSAIKNLMEQKELLEYIAR